MVRKMARKISRKDGISLRKHAEKTREEFESAAFYEKLLKDMMRVRGTENKELKKDDICLYFDVWREPYRIRDKNVSETFTEIIIGKVENSNPLNFSEALSLDTYHDRVAYSTGRVTWSGGSMISTRQLIPVDYELFQRLKIALKTRNWEKEFSYDRRHITTFVRNLENFFNGRYPGKNYRVVKKQVLVGEANRLNAIISLEVEAPEIAAEARPGQFLVIRLHERGERIPLTIADIKKDEGSVRIIFQVVGKTTEELATLKEGDLILDLLGPLGNPVEIRKYDKPVICVAGGVGVASIYAKTKALKEKGNYVISIIGAKSKEILILEEEMRKVSDEIYITTDDGSYRFTKDGTECLHRVRKDGFKIYGAFVDSVLEALFSKYKLLSRENDRIKEPDKKFLDYGPRQMVGRYSVEDIEEIIAVGPIRMMWAVVNLVAGNGKYRPEREYKEGLIKTLVSLNPIMVDGTGLCGCCRTRIYNPEAKDYATKFACVDGPVFNGLLVDFESLLRRTGQYKTKEQKSVKYLEVTGW